MNNANPLRYALEQFNPLPDAVWEDIAALISKRVVAAGEQLLCAGERASNIFFIRSGLLREYYLDDAGHESTRAFCVEGGFAGSLADLIGGGKAMVSIEALDASELWVLNWSAIDALSEIHPALMKLIRRFAEALYVRKMTREFEMLTLSATERYRRFVRDFPALNQRLHRNMLASYLGITPVHLSRICSAEK
jgi:CRP-like cAMP-binding protein